MTVTTRQSLLSVTRPVNNGTFTIHGEGINHRRVALIKSAQLFQQIEGPRMSLVQALRKSPVDSSISHRSSLAAGPLHTDCVTIVQS